MGGDKQGDVLALVSDYPPDTIDDDGNQSRLSPDSINSSILYHVTIHISDKTCNTQYAEEAARSIFLTPISVRLPPSAFCNALRTVPFPGRTGQTPRGLKLQNASTLPRWRVLV